MRFRNVSNRKVEFSGGMAITYPTYVAAYYQIALGAPIPRPNPRRSSQLGLILKARPGALTLPQIHIRQYPHAKLTAKLGYLR